jgi:hypothetical protein
VDLISGIESHAGRLPKMRNLAVVMSALAALAAQAQQIQPAAPAESTNTAGVRENAERSVVLASRTSTGSTSGATQPAAPGESPDTATKPRNTAATGTAGHDCSSVETYLGGGELTVRTYPAPPASEASGAKGWKRAPYVASVSHCGQVFVFQVRSRSRDAWVIRQARLEGPNGELLQVDALFSREAPDRRSVNVIVARAPVGTRLSRLRLDLTGEDGRVAQAEVGDLP